ncbi:MAG: NADH-quinone oxidoreductase subunit L [Polyangiaceae bacterium]|nr:NADH-quinone oxidoreductase subunit L [Polyangiaceae bacterium]
MNTLEGWARIVPLLALAIPAIYALTALTSPRRAGLAAGAAPALALLFAGGAAATGGASGAGSVSLGVRIDALTCTMLLLVGALGAIIVRYSRAYLQGDPGLERYLRWLLLTLGAVSILLLSNNLLVVALGWTATSVTLHQLLTFYQDRTPALVAAHKKFLVSRLADLCFLVSLVLVDRTVGSLALDRIYAWTAAHPQLNPSMQGAAVLVVVAVALRSAQLPFHGWLLQVMEAPTPISALLHAGVVNLGGFLLIRLAPWMVHAHAAQLLLVILGLTSAILAALVMTTRVSVKVALAWSTCAQMGFMLVQCGLGLWHLALLHLVAHSLYKAHAFLSAGTAVEEWRLQSLSGGATSFSRGRLLGATLVAGGSVVFGVLALRRLVPMSPAEELSTPVFAALVGLSMVPLLASRVSGVEVLLGLGARVVGVILLYTGVHGAAALLMPPPVQEPSTLAWALVASGFLGLFALKTALQQRPHGALANRLYPWLFAGFYLDEGFTRLTFRLWPPRLQPQGERARPLELQQPVEARA